MDILLQNKEFVACLIAIGLSIAGVLGAIKTYITNKANILSINKDRLKTKEERDSTSKEIIERIVKIEENYITKADLKGMQEDITEMKTKVDEIGEMRGDIKDLTKTVSELIGYMKGQESIVNKKIGL